MKRTFVDRWAARAIALPWWAWLVGAILTWGLGRLMVGLPVPRGAPLPAIVAISLVRAGGHFISLFGPFALLALSGMSAWERTNAWKRDWEYLDAGRVEPVFDNSAAPSVQSVPTTSEPVRFEPVADIAAASSVPIASWSPELLKALQWKRVEQLAAMYFRALKFRVDEAVPGPDGGIDLRLYSSGSATVGVLVQCKAWNTWQVGVDEIRQLYGVMAAEGVKEGVLVTTSTFSRAAIEWARGKEITLIDLHDLQRKLQNLPTDEQRYILKAVTAGDYWTPSCPSCGSKMIRRDSPRVKSPFWGCPRYPRCRAKIYISRK